jgi:hypothetical protein
MYSPARGVEAAAASEGGRMKRSEPEASGVLQQVVAAASSINQNVCTMGVIKFKINGIIYGGVTSIVVTS